MPSFEAMAFRKFWGQFLKFVKVPEESIHQLTPCQSIIYCTCEWMLEFSIFGVFLQRFSPELISWQAAITPTLNSQLQLTLDFYDLQKNCQNRLK